MHVYAYVLAHMRALCVLFSLFFSFVSKFVLSIHVFKYLHFIMYSTYLFYFTLIYMHAFKLEI